MISISDLYDSLKYKIEKDVDMEEEGFREGHQDYDAIVNALNDATNNGLLDGEVLDATKGILDIENDRLGDKASAIENANKGKMRVLQLNESYRKRQSAYMNIIILIVFVLAVVICLKFISRRFGIIPDAINSLIHMLMFSGVIIYGMVTFMSVHGREMANYDRLDIPGPEIDTDAALAARRQKAIDSGNLLGVNNSSMCKGAVCCNDVVGIEWVPALGKCDAVCSGNLERNAGGICE